MAGHAPPAGEGLCRSELLRRRAEYQRCYSQGRKRHGSLLSLHVHPRVVAPAAEVADASPSGPRLGITASRKVGNSVVRHLLKRRVRESYRRWPGRAALPALDVVVHLKPAAALASWSELSTELRTLLARLAPGAPR